MSSQIDLILTLSDVALRVQNLRHLLDSNLRPDDRGVIADLLARTLAEKTRIEDQLREATRGPTD